MTALWGYLALLGLVAGERGAELSVSSRNARRLLAAGGVETGKGLYRVMVVFHAVFLPALALGAIAHREPPSPWAWLAVAGAAAAQGLRWWAVRTLGERWTTRVIVLPGARPVTAGPYRWLRHPNYLAVVLEMACLPLAWGMWRLALFFTLGNAAILAVRIREEERALGPEWQRHFSGTGRFLP
jgi:methyltransferase